MELQNLNFEMFHQHVQQATLLPKVYVLLSRAYVYTQIYENREKTSRRRLWFSYYGVLFRINVFPPKRSGNEQKLIIFLRRLDSARFDDGSLIN